MNPLDASYENFEKGGARGNPFDPNWIERSGTHVTSILHTFLSLYLLDAASQTSRAEPMTINDASYLPTVLVPEIVDPVNAPDAPASDHIQAREGRTLAKT